MRRSTVARGASQVVLVALLAGLLGCDPDTLVLWSPDGSSATVIGGEGLHLARPDGSLSPVLVPKAVKAAWSADSRKLVVGIATEDATWSGVERLLPEAVVARVKEVAPAIVDPNEFPGLGVEQIFKQLEREQQSGDELYAAALYLKEKHARELGVRFGEEGEEAAKGAVAAVTLKVFAVAGDKVEEVATIGAVAGTLREVRVAPTGRAVAYTIAGTTQMDLLVATTDGSARPVLVAADVAQGFDWTADGTSLVYCQAMGPRPAPGSSDDLRRGVIRVTKVTGIDGGPARVLPLEDRPRVDLAQVAFAHVMRIRCTGGEDERAIFSAVPVALPAAGASLEDRQTLYSVALKGPAQVTRLLDEAATRELPDGVAAFELSPDKARVAIAGTGSALAVVDLRTKAITTVQAARGDLKQRLIPSWRNDQELTYAVFNEGEAKQRRPGEVYVWSAAGGAPRHLSKSWPDEAVAALKSDK